MRRDFDDYDDFDGTGFETEPTEFDWVCIIEGDGMNRICYYTNQEFEDYGKGEALTFFNLIDKPLFDLSWVQESLIGYIPSYGSNYADTITNVTMFNTAGEKVLLDSFHPEDAKIEISKFLRRVTGWYDCEEIIDEIMGDEPQL